MHGIRMKTAGHLNDVLLASAKAGAWCTVAAIEREFARRSRMDGPSAPLVKACVGLRPSFTAFDDGISSNDQI